MLLLSGIWAPRGPGQLDLCQLLLTEAITLALRQEYAYGLFLPAEPAAPCVREILALQGFAALPEETGEPEALAVDMRRPIVLTRNVDTAIKAPLSSNPRGQWPPGYGWS